MLEKISEALLTALLFSTDTYDERIENNAVYQLTIPPTKGSVTVNGTCQSNTVPITPMLTAKCHINSYYGFSGECRK